MKLRSKVIQLLLPHPVLILLKAVAPPINHIQNVIMILLVCNNI